MERTLTAGISRRSLCRELAALAAASVLFTGGSAFASSNAGTFLQNVGERAVELLGNTAIPQAQREQQFMELLQSEFDVPRISRFIVGRYWRGSSEQAQKDFIAVFSQVMAQRFVPLFTGATKEQFTVSGVRDDKDPGIKFVDLSIQTNDGKVAKTMWRVAEEGSGFKILDVVVEGASMAITLRSEYSGVIKQRGGKLEELTAMLRDRVE